MWTTNNKPVESSLQVVTPYPEHTWTMGHPPQAARIFHILFLPFFVVVLFAYFLLKPFPVSHCVYDVVDWIQFCRNEKHSTNVIIWHAPPPPPTRLWTGVELRAQNHDYDGCWGKGCGSRNARSVDHNLYKFATMIFHRFPPIKTQLGARRGGVGCCIFCMMKRHTQHSLRLSHTFPPSRDDFTRTAIPRWIWVGGWVEGGRLG